MSIEQRLRKQATAIAMWTSQAGTAPLMIEAASTIAGMRRALEAALYVMGDEWDEGDEEWDEARRAVAAALKLADGGA